MLRCSIRDTSIPRRIAKASRSSPIVPRNPWLSLTADVTRLYFEAQDVIGLRLLATARGDTEAGEEALLMILEKGQAAWDAQFLLTKSVASGEIHLAPARAVALYRRRVQANHRRLSRRSRLSRDRADGHEDL